MKLGCLSTLATLATAVTAGLDYISFWWVLLPAFFAGSFSLSNGPHYAQIIEANRQGRLGFFPMMLAISIGSYVIGSAAIYWLARALSN